jgi:hypothetical protein
MLFDVTRLGVLYKGFFLNCFLYKGFFLKFFDFTKMSTYSLEEVLRVLTNSNIPNTAQVETSVSNLNNNLSYYNLSPEVRLLF